MRWKKGTQQSGKASDFPSDFIILMEIGHGLDPNVKVARAPSRAPSIPTHWDHRVSTRNDPTTQRPLSAPKFDRTDISSGDTFARQRPLTGNSLNDEQWSDDLRSHQTTMFEGRRVLGKRHGPESQLELLRTRPQRNFQNPKIQEITRS